MQTFEIKPAIVFVAVRVGFNTDGDMMLTELTWEDGTDYAIARVTDVRQGAARKAGGQGDRYTVQVQGKSSFLFFERNTSLTGNNIGRWFVERR